MYWQRYKEIFLKMRMSTPQISMFWSSYGLGDYQIRIPGPKKHKIHLSSMGVIFTSA